MRIGNIETSRIVWGIAHSAVGLFIAWKGGFAGFERVMSICTGVMVVSVIVTAGMIVVTSDAALIASIVPRELPSGRDQWIWILGVLGGVGGTVTMLSYGYWIREAGRTGAEGLRESRYDLAFSYALTALFGCAMVIIGSRITGTGKGAAVAIQLSDQLASSLGTWARWVFLAGFWAAVFTSLLGVWQSAPYIFADFMRVRKRWSYGIGNRNETSDAQNNMLNDGADGSLDTKRDYRWFLLAIATLPLVLLWGTVKEVQVLYTTLGAAFMPLTALTLLVMNNRVKWVGEYRNRAVANILLVVTLAVFTYLAIAGIRD